MPAHPAKRWAARTPARSRSQSAGASPCCRPTSALAPGSPCTAPQAADGASYGYQWWIADGAPAGEVNAQGIYGQYIWIDRTRNIVIAVNAADRGFEDPGVASGNIALFRRIADAL